MDAEWATAQNNLSFPLGVGLRVSIVASCSEFGIPDPFTRSGGAYRAYELIVERFGKSVKVQGNGPVSTPVHVHAILLSSSSTCSGTSDYSRSILFP